MANRWFDQDAFLEWVDEEIGIQSSSGDEIIVECPACGTPKLWINTDSGMCTCYRCEFGGSLYDVMREAAGIEKSEARKILGVDREKPTEHADGLEAAFAPPPISVISAPTEEFPQVIPPGVRWYGIDQASCNMEAMMATAALEAMHRRGFDNEIILRNRAGWCWVGPYQERVILPVFRNGKIVWWQAWDYGKKFGNMKYKNPPNEEVPYGRKELVYNIERWVGVDLLVICEGIFNCWALEQLGVAAVCTFGKFMSDFQLMQILMHPAQRVLIGLDPDAREYAGHLQGVFSGHGRQASLCTLPGTQDFNDLQPQDRLAVLAGAGEPDWLFDR